MARRVEASVQEPPPAASPPPAPTPLDRGLSSAREAHAWLRRLGEPAVVVELALAGVLLVWFTRRVIGIHSTAFLLVELLLPPVTYLAVRRQATVALQGWGRPVRAFRDWLATMGEVGTVIELGLLGLFLIWFTKAIAGIDSIVLYAIQFVLPQLMYLILVATSARSSEADQVVEPHGDPR